MKTILAVDNEIPMLESLEYLLKDAGYQVYATSVPDDVFLLLRERSIQLLLLDVHMPKKSGFTLCRQVVARQQLPVLFVTGFPDSFSDDSLEIRNLWKEQFIAGTTDIIYKPFNSALLCEKVESLIGPSESGTASSSFDIETNRLIRQILVKYRIDLGKISLNAENGSVLLRGVMSRLSKDRSELDEPTILSILSEMKSIPNARGVVLQPGNLIDLGTELQPVLNSHARA
jgi:DNA-binding response OmpR family regulator